MTFHYRLAWVITLGLVRLLWKFRGFWSERIPSRGPAVIACNHVSNWDPLLVGLGCRREVHFLAKEELFKNRALAWLIRSYNAVPVKRGRVDRRALRTAARTLDSDGALLMFPEGTRSRNGEIGKGRPGVGYLAATTGAPVVPAYITGSQALFECFRTRRRLVVSYGEPMRPPDPGDSETYEEFTARVMERIRDLRREVESRWK